MPTFTSFNCPKCQKRLKVRRDVSAQTRVACSGCRQAFCLEGIVGDPVESGKRESQLGIQAVPVRASAPAGSNSTSSSGTSYGRKRTGLWPAGTALVLLVSVTAGLAGYFRNGIAIGEPPQTGATDGRRLEKPALATSPQQQIEAQLSKVGEILEKLNSATEAEQIGILRECLPVAEKAFTLGETYFPKNTVSPEIHLAAREAFLKIRAALSKLLEENGQFQEAVELNRDSRALAARFLGEDHFNVRNMLLEELVAKRLKSLSSEDQRRYLHAKSSPLVHIDPSKCILGGTEMQRELEHLLAALGATAGEDSWLCADIQTRIAMVRLGLGEEAAIEALLPKTESVYGRNHPRYFYSLVCAGGYIMHRGKQPGDLRRGIKMLLEADQICKSVHEDHDPQRYQVSEALAQQDFEGKCMLCAGSGQVSRQGSPSSYTSWETQGMPDSQARCRHCQGTGRRS